MKFPVIFKILIPLMVGVILHFYSSFSIDLNLLLFFALVLLLLLVPKLTIRHLFTQAFGLMTGLFFFALGGVIAEVHHSSSNESYFKQFDTEADSYLVEVTEPPEEKDKSVKCVVQVLQVGEQQTMGKSLVYIEKTERSERIRFGDQLFLSTSFNAIRQNGNPKEFDYQRYLRIHDIKEQAYVTDDSWQHHRNVASPFYSWVYGLRNELHERIDKSGLSRKNAMVANALILGQKEYLDKDVLRSYSSAGAMHVLAVSGLHVGIIMLILNFFLAPLKRVRFGKSLFILGVLGGIWFYALITGMSPSVMRAGVMFTFIVLGKQMERHTSVYQSILVSAFVLILLQPYIIFQVGFQLSYLAVLGIVYLQPKIVNLLYIKNKVLHKAWQISAVSIAAQIATFPLGLYYFHQFPNFFLLSNLLVIPLAFFILLVGISFLIMKDVPLVGEGLVWVLEGLLSILNTGVEWVEKLPYSISWGYSITWYEVLILYCSLLLASAAFINRKAKLLVSALVGVVVLLLINIQENERLKSENQICFYNVNNEVAFDVFYGQENYFYSSQALALDEEKLLFNIKHNWFYRTGREKPTKWVDVEEVNSLTVGEKMIYLLDQNMVDNWETLPLDFEYAVFCEVDFVPLELLNSFGNHDVNIILSNQVPYRTSIFVKNNISNTSLVDLNDGAFELTF